MAGGGEAGASAAPLAQLRGDEVREDGERAEGHPRPGVPVQAQVAPFVEMEGAGGGCESLEREDASRGALVHEEELVAQRDGFGELLADGRLGILIDWVPFAALIGKGWVYLQLALRPQKRRPQAARVPWRLVRAARR